jgi:hypothetical protein
MKDLIYLVSPQFIEEKVKQILCDAKALLYHQQSHEQEFSSLQR